MRKQGKWPTWVVRYWNQDPRINDCFGNSISWVGKARTKNEAIKKAQAANTSRIWFRLADFYVKA